MDTNKIHERYDNTLKTGEWWTNPWWQEDCYYNDRLFTREEAESAFIQLKEIFDAKWVRKQRDAVIAKAKKWLKEHEQEVSRNPLSLDFKEKLDNLSSPSEDYETCTLLGFRSEHPLFNEFFKEGLGPFNYLVALGRGLRNVKDAKRIGNLPKRLKNANQYSGAHFELKMLAHLTRLGYSIERDIPSGRGNQNADFRIEKGSEVIFIELKSLEWSRTNKEIYAISCLFNPFFDLAFRNLLISSNSMILHPELSEDLKAKIIKNDLSLQSLQKIAQQLWKHIIERINKKEWGHHTLEKIAEYDLFQRKGNGVGDTDGFFKSPFSMEKEAKKIFEVIDTYKERLPDNQPGIFMINISFPLNCLIPALSMYKEWQKYRKISAIILIYTYFSSKGICHDLIPIQNPNPDAHNVMGYTVLQDILKLANH